jgi:Xaa-Pro aminopeptidase
MMSHATGAPPRRVLVLLACAAIAASACSVRVGRVVGQDAARAETESEAAWLSAPSPWPAIRRERITRLLPAAMRDANVDAWLVMLRENANDPLALHVGGENAGAPSAVLFLREGDRVRSVMVSGFGEAIALRELGLHDSVVVYDGGVPGLERAVAERIRQANPSRIAVNSAAGGISDGLSWTQRVGLEKALGAELASRLASSEPLVQRWLAIKLPAEVDIMRRAAALTVKLEEEAYATIVPGVTKDSDLARHLKRRMRELGVEDAWHPAQNPSVNSGPDRGHSHASDRVIQRGEVIQTDFGIKVHGVWVTDIQRFAYVLREGESRPPALVQERWEKARDGGRAAFGAMRPGATGAQVDSAQRLLMARDGSLPVPWSTGHGVGYWAHDAGPRLNRAEQRPLAPGMTFAFDGFHAWMLEGGAPRPWGEGTKTISVEEMVVITDQAAQYLTPPQQELILVRGR